MFLKWKNPKNKKVTAEDEYNKYKKKIQMAKNEGFEVFEIWSDENIEIQLEKIFNEIQKRSKNNN